jgi:hypothetical protein
MNAKKISYRLMSLSVFAMVGVTSCASSGPSSEPRVSKPLVTDLNEVHWRMYYEDQFDTYSKAVPPGAGDPDVAWTAYYSEKNSHAIRENNKLLREQLRLQKKEDRERND